MNWIFFCWFADFAILSSLFWIYRFGEYFWNVFFLTLSSSFGALIESLCLFIIIYIYLNIDNNSAFVFRARNCFLESFPMRNILGCDWDSDDSIFSQMLSSQLTCEFRVRVFISIALRTTNLRLWLLTN